MSKKSKSNVSKELIDSSISISETPTESSVSKSEHTSNDITKDIIEMKAELSEIKAIIKDFKKNLKGLVEIQQRLVHERLKVAIPPSPQEYGGESNLKVKINITCAEGNKIKVSGNTYDIKDTIKNTGGKFESSTKSWLLPFDCLDQLVKNFEAINLVKDTDFSVNIGDKQKNKNVVDGEEEEEGFGSGF